MKGITKKTALLPGKTVAVFGGIHGNERVGIETVKWAVETFEPERGTVYFVEANPIAIAQNIRSVQKNLNRCFFPNNTGATEEDIRARELMSILNECDALLDIHSSNSKDSTPFAICEQDGIPLARTLDFPIVSTGWDAIEPGAADGYMYQNGKLGICLECGSIYDADANITRAHSSVLRFLKYFDIISDTSIERRMEQRHIRVFQAAYKLSDKLSFVKNFADFEPLIDGEVFARDNGVEYVASEGDCIIFARPDAPIGTEAFVLGKEEPVSLITPAEK